MIGTKLSDIEITEEVGSGGMGVVYRAYDSKLEREVAVKVLHKYLTQDPVRLEAFRREAITQAKLSHPNIVALYNFLEIQGEYYMVMEFVNGKTLSEVIKGKGILPWREALETLCQALRGFEHAHSRGIIHRDIKPGNLMVDESGTVKITDFGIARVVGKARLTKTGFVKGTYEYMSPEQVRGGEQDARSDIYSLGILLYEMLSGQVPFSGTSEFNIMRGHLEESPKPLNTVIPGILPAIDAAIVKALEKSPENRFQSARDFRLCLENILDPQAEAVAPKKRTQDPIPEGSVLFAPRPPAPTLQTSGENEERDGTKPRPEVEEMGIFLPSSKQSARSNASGAQKSQDRARSENNPLYQAEGETPAPMPAPWYRSVVPIVVLGLLALGAAIGFIAMSASSHPRAQDGNNQGSVHPIPIPIPTTNPPVGDKKGSTNTVSGTNVPDKGTGGDNKGITGSGPGTTQQNNNQGNENHPTSTTGDQKGITSGSQGNDTSHPKPSDNGNSANSATSNTKDTQQRIICPVCGTSNRIGSHFCKKCGHWLQDPKDKKP